MSSNAFVNGARMSGICAFIAGYFETHEHKTLLIHRTATVIYSHLPLRYRVHNN